MNSKFLFLLSKAIGFIKGKKTLGQIQSTTCFNLALQWRIGLCLSLAEIQNLALYKSIGKQAHMFIYMLLLAALYSDSRVE